WVRLLGYRYWFAHGQRGNSYNRSEIWNVCSDHDAVRWNSSCVFDDMLGVQSVLAWQQTARCTRIVVSRFNSGRNAGAGRRAMLLYMRFGAGMRGVACVEVDIGADAGLCRRNSGSDERERRNRRNQKGLHRSLLWGFRRTTHRLATR